MKNGFTRNGTELSLTACVGLYDKTQTKSIWQHSPGDFANPVSKREHIL
jgi:hypothetical protein